MSETAITLLEFNSRVKGLLQDSRVQHCWVVAETSDVGVRGGHCYLELIQKDPERGQTLAKARAVIWANRFAMLRYAFETATGQAFGSGLKVMVEVTASFHELYGLSLQITNINPTYTLGDMARLRMEILRRLKAEGILTMNKELEWPSVAQRIAVISAGTAAGYGDFIDQLHRNPSGIQFYTCLFQATMQGVNTAPSVIAALERINRHADLFDCVVIIRGGGATSELNSFDNYELAANVAQFPLPVISGIGHDRDNTVIDEVASVRVKTPTAAAEWLIDRAQQALDNLNALTDGVIDLANRMVSDSRQQLAYISGVIPYAVRATLERNRAKLDNYMQQIPMRASMRVDAARKDLSRYRELVGMAVRQQLRDAARRVDMLEGQVNLLSPQQVLRRGYSLTLKNGKAVTNASMLQAGDIIETHLAQGSVKSEVK